jgi:hypothetical protein
MKIMLKATTLQELTCYDANHGHSMRISRVKRLILRIAGQPSWLLKTLLELLIWAVASGIRTHCLFSWMRYACTFLQLKRWLLTTLRCDTPLIIETFFALWPTSLAKVTLSCVNNARGDIVFAELAPLLRLPTLTHVTRSGCGITWQVGLGHEYEYSRGAIL